MGGVQNTLSRLLVCIIPEYLRVTELSKPKPNSTQLNTIQLNATLVEVRQSSHLGPTLQKLLDMLEVEIWHIHLPNQPHQPILISLTNY